MSIATVFLAPINSSMLFYDMDQVKACSQLIAENAYQKIGALFTEKTGEEAAEEMFDLSNNPSREEERAERWGSYRSLSVGDVVHVDGDSYLCKSTGWHKL